MDGGTAVATEIEGEESFGGSVGAWDDEAQLLGIDGADAVDDVVGDVIGEVGVCGAAVEDDGKVDIVLGEGLVGGGVGEGEGGEDDGEIGVGAVGTLLDREGGEGWGVSGGVDAAEEDGAIGGILSG